MKQKLINLLIKLKLVHGGHIEVREYEKYEFEYFMICYKCDCEMWLMYDDDVEPGLWAILCGDPWKFTTEPSCCDYRNTWRWNGKTLCFYLD